MISHFLKKINILSNKKRRNSNHQTDTEKELISDLRRKIRLLAPLRLSKSGANNVWIKHRNALRLHILNKDPNHFLQWDFIKNTMSGENSPYADNEFCYLKNSPYWSNRYAKALTESPIGSPEVYKKYPHSSCNLIHQAYHISQFESKTGIMINRLKVVLEFGGGYGNMCLLFHNLGFKGKYIIFDSEEFSALQEYYLKSSGIEVLNIDANHRFINGVACISNVSKLKPLLPERGNNLFLATWSISETSISFRNNFFGSFPDFKNYLIAYRDKFREINNVSYFSSFIREKKELYWHNWEIPHLKDNFYLLGSEIKM